MRAFARLSAATCALLLAGPATAQPKPAPSPPRPAPAAAPTAPDPKLEEAKVHFQQGVALYNDGNFNGALAEFESAYRTRPSPGVLYNIGLTQKALFRYAEAVDTFNRYLAEDPKLTPERRSEVQNLVGEMNALLAPVTLDVAPAGVKAQVLVDGRTAGEAPLGAPLRLSAGNHVVEIVAEGYKPFRKELMVTAGVPLALQPKLELIPKTGHVKISAKPAEALIRIDGKPLGFAPVETELGAGGHQLEAEAPKYLTLREELVIAAGQSRELSISLSKPPKRLVEQWYLWTPITVVVAGGLAVGLGLGLRSPGPLDGTLGTGKVN